MGPEPVRQSLPHWFPKEAMLGLKLTRPSHWFVHPEQWLSDFGKQWQMLRSLFIIDGRKFKYRFKNYFSLLKSCVEISQSDSLTAAEKCPPIS